MVAMIQLSGFECTVHFNKALKQFLNASFPPAPPVPNNPSTGFSAPAAVAMVEAHFAE